MLAVRGGGLFDGEAARPGPALVLLEDGRIVDVDATGADPPPGAELVDLPRCTLLPGLVDAHTHLVFDPGGDATVDVGAPEETLLDRMRRNAATALAAGITTLRDLGDRDYLAGRLVGDAAGPELRWSGPPITPTRGHCWFLGGEADGVGGVRAAVAERAAAGVDVVKIMATGGLMTPGYGVHESQYGPAELRAVVAAADEAGLPVAAHAHGPAGIADAVAAGVHSVEHCTFLTADGVAMDARTVDALVATGTVVDATEAWLPEGEPLPPLAAERLDRCRANVVRMLRAGATVVLSSDAGVGPRKPHDVLPHAVILFAGLGFTNAEALAAVTSVAARACGVGRRKGRLARGYDADLVAVAGDPTRDPRALLDVRAVVRAGRLVGAAGANPDGDRRR